MMNQEARILVVDDDKNMCRMLSSYLCSEGFEVKVAHSGDELTREVNSRPIDLVLLDLHMPGFHGLDLARELRSRDTQIGIIILTGSEDPVDRVVGLEVGADDFVAKPFDRRELLARIRTLLRRIKKQETVTIEGRVCFDRFTLDLDTHELVDEDGYVINLTNYEFTLLSAMVGSPNRVLSRDLIMNTISGRDWFASDRSVDVLVGKIRKKIETNAARPILIKTIRGAGYKFTGKVSKLASRTDNPDPQMAH
jgi:DNA-binding response OmpR family regulator